MCNRDNLESNINHIYDNLELLEAGNIYELRGCCSTESLFCRYLYHFFPG